ncbi:twin-arginine translocase TatA/TatE family subunit [Glaciecola sp. 2405UD65-10]|uniref:twin-arginine translocase TatA/TatE family subunit n=1 Tax=Glaciecola sp. 2405UD65-10 TaxID=3397244 RepID=UPI003B5A04EC
MMGMSGWQILVILVLVVLLFGTSKLRNVGSDLGSALKGFKKSMSDDDEKPKTDADFEPLDKPEQNNQPSNTTQQAETKQNTKD